MAEAGMDTLTYLAACLVAALLAVALISAVLVRVERQHGERRAQALRLQQALARYSDWLIAQRLVAVFQGEGPQAAAALDEACTVRLAWFPELAGDMAELLAVHNRMLHFLATQQALWQRDPENWLASDHDKRFMALWKQHRFALQALLAKLQQAASVRLRTAHPRQSTYA
jgi:hypothetical protein